MPGVKLSLIIVHFKAKTELFNCLASIAKAKPKVAYEIVVVDNDEEKVISEELRQKFPQVKYLKSPGNIGFGAGNNLGAKASQGEFLFFLNPDTLIFPETIDTLVDFLGKNREAGIVAPILLDENRKPYILQVGKLTPLTAMVALSFFNKYFPQNPISQRYWLKSFGQDPREVETFPGTAFLIRRKTFEGIGGFDPKLFLFFEEMDLSLRARKAGFKIFIIPKTPIIHLGEKSTPDSDKIKKIFRQSRFYYLKKHFGTGWAVLTESFLRSTEWLAEKI